MRSIRRSCCQKEIPRYRFRTFLMMTELNIIHPFREGNGRNIRELIRCMGLEYGLHLNWGNTDRDTLINAAIASVDDDMAFCDVLMQCLETEE